MFALPRRGTATPCGPARIRRDARLPETPFQAHPHNARIRTERQPPTVTILKIMTTQPGPSNTFLDHKPLWQNISHNIPQHIRPSHTVTSAGCRHLTGQTEDWAAPVGPRLFSIGTQRHPGGQSRIRMFASQALRPVSTPTEQGYWSSMGSFVIASGPHPRHSTVSRSTLAIQTRFSASVMETIVRPGPAGDGVDEQARHLAHAETQRCRHHLMPSRKPL